MKNMWGQCSFCGGAIFVGLWVFASPCMEAGLVWLCSRSTGCGQRTREQTCRQTRTNMSVLRENKHVSKQERTRLFSARTNMSPNKNGHVCSPRGHAVTSQWALSLVHYVLSVQPPSPAICGQPRNHGKARVREALGCCKGVQGPEN